MTKTASAGRGPARILRLFDQITRLSPAERCLLLCAFTLVPATASWLLFWQGLRSPASVPYLNQAFLPTVLWIQGVGFIGAWATLFAFALWARRHAPRSKVLGHATCQLCALWALGSYILGHFTFPYLGM